MALSRASLAQDYDVGEEGRFGNQLRETPLLRDLQFGVRGGDGGCGPSP